MNPGQRYRIRRNPPYVNASKRWWIELLFNSDLDIAVFEKAVPEAGMRFIEFGSRFFLEDPRIPDVGDRIEAGFEVILRYGAEQIARLNTAVRIVCPEFVPAKLRCMIYIDEKGEGHPLAMAEGVTHGINEVNAMRTFLERKQSEMPDVVQLYRKNEDVRATLYYFGQEGNPWPHLYKVREIIADAVGGDSRIVELNWCSKKELSRFDRSANHQEAIGQFSRHTRAKADPPPNLMTETDARAFILKILRRWVQHLLNSAS